MQILTYVVAGLIVESLWETSKMFWQNGKLSKDRVGALVFGELVAILGNLDFLQLIGINLKFKIIAVILTGLLISRGSNFMHNLINSVETSYIKGKN